LTFRTRFLGLLGYLIRLLTLLVLAVITLGFGVCGAWGTWSGFMVVRDSGWNVGIYFALMFFIAGGVGLAIAFSGVSDIRAKWAQLSNTSSDQGDTSPRS
jgi:hypothetical protein